MNGSNEPHIDSLIQSTGMIIECRLHGIKSMFISSLVCTTRVKLSILEETYERFEVFYRTNGVILIDNRNLAGHHLRKEDLHLLESETNRDTPSILSNLKLKNVNRLVMGYLNINSLASKFDQLKVVIENNIDILICY